MNKIENIENQILKTIQFSHLHRLKSVILYEYTDLHYSRKFKTEDVLQAIDNLIDKVKMKAVDLGVDTEFFIIEE